MSDLVIGTRRSASRIRTVIALLVVAAVLVSAARLIFSRLVSYPRPHVAVKKSELAYQDGALRASGGALERIGAIDVVTLRGTPAQIGYAHGRLLAGGIGTSMERALPSIRATIPESHWLSFLSEARLRWRHRLLDDGIPGHQLVELEALSRGAAQRDRYEDLVRLQAVDDVGKPPATTLGASLRTMTRSLTALVPIHNEKGDRLVLAHTLSRPGLAGSPHPPVLFIVKGDGAIPYASVGQPGLIGVDSGVNAEGVAVVVHPGRSRDVQVTNVGQPAGLVAREVLEQARTLTDAATIIDKAEVLGAASFLVVDGKSRKHVVIERSPEHRGRDTERTVVDGIFATRGFRDDPINDRARRMRPDLARLARARSLVRKHPADIDAVVSLLRDRRGDGGEPLPVGHRGAIDDPAAEQVVILDPSTMVLWVGEGPGAAGGFRAFDLRYRLGVSAHGPAAPADVPPADTDAPRRVVRARAVLEQALVYDRRGRHRRASETAERAVTLAPELPLARLLAGRLAERAGRRESARAHLRAFLAQPDDPGQREQIEAVVGSR